MEKKVEKTGHGGFKERQQKKKKFRCEFGVVSVSNNDDEKRVSG